jgi:PAS domain S-box-containing protein
MQKIGDNVWEHNFVTEETVFSQQEFLLLDYDSEEFDKNSDLWYNSIHNDDKQVVIDNDKQYRSGAIDNHSLEYRMITKDGSLKWVLDRGVVIEKAKDGKPLKIIGTHTDITQQKQIEEELKKAKDAAEASTKAKELFLANMSHEIRTPMNAIVGMSGQLGKTILNKDQKFYLSTIKSAADNLLVIINDILDLSKIEAGKLTMEQIGFEPKLVLDRVMQVMIHKAEERGLSFTNSYCDSRLSPVLIGDPYRLNQILLNLISNSIKFTEKGSVDIRCIMKSENDKEQLVEVQVVDTGIGMDESFSKNLFQKFKQEDDSITRKYGGTGLGMSICKELVELMGGEIAVSSKKGEGTTVSFIVVFKKGAAEDLPKKNIEEVDVSSLYGKRILVTDDNEMNRLVASTILNNYGVEIEEASNGKIAIQKIQAQQFDIVLMDVQMPEMDGMEATRYIRNNISKDLPIVALTAFAVKGDSEKFINSGMNDYLSKPFDEAQLLSVLIKLLGGAQKKQVPVIALHKMKEPETDLYDLSKLEDIAKGNKVFIDKMIALFVEQVPLSVTEIKDAYAAKDFEKVKKTAHRIKPSIDSMGIALLTNDIREIEKMADVYQTSEQLESLITKLDDVINKVVTKLTK